MEDEEKVEVEYSPEGHYETNNDAKNEEAGISPQK